MPSGSADHRALSPDPPPKGLEDPDPVGLGPPGGGNVAAIQRLRDALVAARLGSEVRASDVVGRLGAVAAAVGAVATVAFVGWLLVGRPSAPDEVGSGSVRPESGGITASTRPAVPASPGGTGPARESGTTVPALVQVHAAGAVVAPGVHRLPAGARVADLVAAAGGLAPDADVDRVNLAAVLVDGSRVYVPRRGEVSVPDVPGGSGSGGGGGGPTTVPKGPVDINRATVEELDTLPGVGPTTAQAIIDHRNRNGPFRSVEDLAKVRGIGPAKLAELRPLVTV